MPVSVVLLADHEECILQVMDGGGILRELQQGRFASSRRDGCRERTVQFIIISLIFVSLLGLVNIGVVSIVAVTAIGIILLMKVGRE